MTYTFFLWKVFAWGCGGHGRLGTGDEENVVEPTKINVSQSIRDIRCTVDATIFITGVNGLEIVAFGRYKKLPNK